MFQTKEQDKTQEEEISKVEISQKRIPGNNHKDAQ